eukprot:UN04052
MEFRCCTGTRRKQIGIGFSKLLIPAVSCHADLTDSREWLKARGYSLWIHLNYMSSGYTAPGIMNWDVQPYNLQFFWSLYNREYLRQTQPNSEQLDEYYEKFGYTVSDDNKYSFTDSTFTGQFTEKDFKLWTTCEFFFTVMVVGWGTEILT